MCRSGEGSTACSLPRWRVGILSSATEKHPIVETTTKWLTAAVAVGVFLPSVLLLENALLGGVAAGAVVWAAITHDRDGSLSAFPVLVAGAVVCMGILSDGYLVHALVGANVVLWIGRNGLPELRSS